MIDLDNGIVFALQEIATAIFDCGINIEYRASLTEDISTAFGKQVLEMAVAKALPLTAEQREVLEAIVDGSCASLSVSLLPYFFGRRVTKLVAHRVPRRRL